MRMTEKTKPSGWEMRDENSQNLCIKKGVSLIPGYDEYLQDIRAYL
jgi:hypothetical protein